MTQLLAACSLWAGLPAAVAEETTPKAIRTAIVTLEFAEAPLLASLFRPAPQDPELQAEAENSRDARNTLAADRRRFLQEAIADSTRGIRPVPDLMADPGLYPFQERSYAEVRIAQADTGRGALASLLPEGLEEPPTALIDQNALLVKGTPQAVDQFREIIALLDKPPKQVNIEVKLLNLGTREQREWGLDLAGRGDRGDLQITGPAPVGPAIRLLGNPSTLVAANRITSRTNGTTGANVTTTNNVPCLIRSATVIPVILASVTYDNFGNRQVDYRVDAVATGIELFVLPRINADDSVTMILRPSFIDATGQVVGPDGTALPITEEVAVETIVRVPDQETVLIGGFPSSLQALDVVGLPVNFRRSTTVEDVQSLLFVTPRIVRFIQQP